MEPIDVEVFEAMVGDALASIPDQLRSEMENVAIIIDDESPPGPLYGLYQGVPLTKRGAYAGANPDQITLFLATICESAATIEELARRAVPRHFAPRGRSPLRDRRSQTARARLVVARKESARTRQVR